VRLSLSQLRKLAPRGKQAILAGLVAPLNHHLPLYGIDTPLRVSHFLAQAAHETDGFRTLTEYATGDAYDTRTDLGNTPARDGDGRLYKGRGIFQLTGRANYRAAGLEHTPAKAGEFEPAVRIACEYWKHRGLNKFADRNDITSITKRINGGYNGMASRRAYYARAWRIWGNGSDATGKQLSHSNTVRASVVAGGATVVSGGLSVADHLYVANEVVGTVGNVSEATGFPFATVALALVALVAIGYIVYDRWFKHKYEGV
jgi:predicted chitinase